MLLRDLPALLHVREATAQAAVLRWALELFADELQRPRPGGALMADRLAQVMLVQVLRLFLAAEPGSRTGEPESRTGWLRALADPQLARAIGAMHAAPGRRWTVADLAAVARMSRSSFADRFPPHGRPAAPRLPGGLAHGPRGRPPAADEPEPRRHRGRARLRVRGGLPHAIPTPDGLHAGPLSPTGMTIRRPGARHAAPAPAGRAGIARCAARTHSASGRASSGSMIGIPSRIG